MGVLSGKTAGRGRGVAASAVFAILTGCAAVGAPPPVGGVAIAPVPAGMARIWFYRIDQPYVALQRPYVRINGAVVGISEPNGAFYRDVAPGSYDVSVDSYGRDVNQFPRIDLSDGATVYLQIIGSRYWASGGASANWARPTFYVWPMPAAVAAPVVARSPFYRGAG